MATDLRIYFCGSAETRVNQGSTRKRTLVGAANQARRTKEIARGIAVDIVVLESQFPHSFAPVAKETLATNDHRATCLRRRVICDDDIESLGEFGWTSAAHWDVLRMWTSCETATFSRRSKRRTVRPRVPLRVVAVFPSNVERTKLVCTFHRLMAPPYFVDCDPRIETVSVALNGTMIAVIAIHNSPAQLHRCGRKWS
jgi:hypothetical protein